MVVLGGRGTGDEAGARQKLRRQVGVRVVTAGIDDGDRNGGSAGGRVPYTGDLHVRETPLC